ncbi:TPA: hypothetical protein TVS37_000533 [Streptococcus equi subsp. zooepidemicus]|nr:hypothetical protein [Streptococcus equi subsp. zooepidemicus]
MSEQYLSIKESLGYKHVKQVLWNVFSVDLDGIKIREGEYENFGFDFKYKGYKMNMGIAATGKRVQFEAGEGGLFDILFSNLKDSVFGITFFYDLVSDKNVSERIRRVFGKDEQSIEYAMRVLKDYLDSDEARVLWKNG